MHNGLETQKSDSFWTLFTTITIVIWHIKLLQEYFIPIL